jgi:hypothetical protein
MKSFSTPTPAPPTSQTKTTRPELTLFDLGIKLFTGTQKAGVLTPHVVGAARFNPGQKPDKTTMKKHTKTRDEKIVRRAQSALDFLTVLLIAGALTAGALHYFDVLIP